MRYLVTGGCGFIGSHLVDRLVSDGHQVVVLDDLSSGGVENLNPSATFVRGSILDAQALDRALAGTDACVHLAAIASVAKSTTDWVGSHQVNVTGLVMLLERIRESRRTIPVVYASSAAIYGKQSRMPIQEEATPMPMSAYGADKFGCELQARIAGICFSMPTIGFRFFNVYGPRQDPASPYSGVISIFARSALAKAPLTIYGDGKQTRDFIYVSDVVDMLVRGVSHASSTANVYNVCTGIGTAVEGLAKLLVTRANADAPILRKPPRLGDIQESVGSPERARRELSFVPQVPLASGIDLTLTWMRKHGGQSWVGLDRA